MQKYRGHRLRFRDKRVKMRNQLKWYKKCKLNRTSFKLQLTGGKPVGYLDLNSALSWNNSNNDPRPRISSSALYWTTRPRCIHKEQNALNSIRASRWLFAHELMTPITYDMDLTMEQEFKNPLWIFSRVTPKRSDKMNSSVWAKKGCVHNGPSNFDNGIVHKLENGGAVWNFYPYNLWNC